MVIHSIGKSGRFDPRIITDPDKRELNKTLINAHVSKAKLKELLKHLRAIYVDPPRKVIAKMITEYDRGSIESLCKKLFSRPQRFGVLRGIEINKPTKRRQGFVTVKLDGFMEEAFNNQRKMSIGELDKDRKKALTSIYLLADAAGDDLGPVPSPELQKIFALCNNLLREYTKSPMTTFSKLNRYIRQCERNLENALKNS